MQDPIHDARLKEQAVMGSFETLFIANGPLCYSRAKRTKYASDLGLGLYLTSGTRKQGESFEAPFSF